MDSKAGTTAFADYLQSVVKLNELEKMTDCLNEELVDSQRILTEIKSIFGSINIEKTNIPVNSEMRHEDLSNFLEAEGPKLLMSDMTESTIDVDIDVVIAKMKRYAEDLKNCVVPPQSQRVEPRANIENLNLEEYATSLDQLSKRLANIKLNKDESSNRDTELETKLTQLCQDVSMFTQMVQTNTTISQCSDKWSTPSQMPNGFCYDDIINKLLFGINEVTYLLQNKN